MKKDEENNSSELTGLFKILLEKLIGNLLGNSRLHKSRHFFISLSGHVAIIGTLLIISGCPDRNKDVVDDVSIVPQEQREEKAAELPKEPVAAAPALNEEKKAPEPKPVMEVKIEPVKKKDAVQPTAEVKKPKTSAAETKAPAAETMGSKVPAVEEARPAEKFSSDDLKKRLEEKLKAKDEAQSPIPQNED